MGNKIGLSDMNIAKVSTMLRIYSDYFHNLQHAISKIEIVSLSGKRKYVLTTNIRVTLSLT